MENKLISLSEYIELQEKLIPYENSGTVAQCDRMFVRRVISYQRFLKQPLTLGMFVPCDENGNVLNEPRMIARTIGFEEQDVFWDIDEVEAYRIAKEKVLFKGFNFEGDLLIIPNFGKQEIKNINGLTIESLTEFEIELTESALKQIGLKEN